MREGKGGDRANGRLFDFIQNHTTREKPMLNTNISEDGVKACSQTHPG